MDIGAWLRSLGLEQYETAFRDNAIDEKILPSLTGEDLKEIGVGPVGHRRSLLDAIAALGAERRSAQASPPDAPSPSAARSLTAALSSPRDDAERRPITVMFCDLVGSTSLAAKLDAEDWRELVNGYLDESSKAVTVVGGHVLKKLGDGLMALFGYPRAQENDAERAARAALTILRALEDLNARNVAKGLPALEARIGLESGPVVVDAAGEVFGEAPNVAARVQSAAEPGTILVTATVQRQVAGLFVVEDKGPYDLKGVAGKPTLYRVVRASGGGRRIFARSVTAFVGREEELALLLRRFERARAGEGQFVQIVAEPGLGKTRLMEEFHRNIAETPHTWVEWSASQLLQMTPLHPLAEWGRQRFGAAENAGEKRLAELESTLAQVKLDPGEHAPLLAPLLDIPLPPERASKLAPEELRRRQLAAVVAWLVAGARVQTIVLAFEDMQWADPTTVDLLKILAERGASAPLFILATARPEFRAPWATRSHHGMLSLVPLDRAQIIRMVASIAERRAFSKEVVDGVSERTGGVPLFVEEVTRLLLERGDTGSGREIPPTLQQSLAARLDRLGDAREVAQIGAVLGREFSFGLISPVASLPEAALAAALEKLADADLMFVEGVGPEANYRFKHALIQDAAYDSLLKGRRQALHRRAAEALLASSDPQPEVLAHHFTQSGQTEPAIEWWGKAGDVALRRSAFEEAISHLGKAIEIADRAGAGEPKRQGATASRVDIRANYARALQVTKGYTAPATQAAFDRAADANAVDSGDSTRGTVDHGRWGQHLFAGELRAALEVGESMLREGEAANLPMRIARGHQLVSLASFYLGLFAEARDHAERAFATWDERWAEEYLAETGSDFICNNCWRLAQPLWALGETEAAEGLMRRAACRAVDLGQPLSLTFALVGEATMYAFANRPEAALRAAEALRDVVAAHAIGAHDVHAKIFRGWAYGRLFDAKAGAEEVRAGLSAAREIGSHALCIQGLLVLANLEAAAGATDEALALVAQGLEIAEPKEFGAVLPRFHQIRGDILSGHDLAVAEDAYRESIRIARGQSARAYELLAALPLAKLLQKQGRLVEAHDVLVPLLEAFARIPSTAEDTGAGVDKHDAVATRTADPSKPSVAGNLGPMPQIAEAQALLATLSETEEVKAASASRERRLRLQVSYGQAVMHAQGFAAEETKAAIARVGELATEAGNEEASLYAYYGQWVQNFWRGEFGSARVAAESFLSRAEREARLTEASVAHRLLGLALLFQGDFAEARAHFEQALRICDPERDREAMFRFGQDPALAATACLAFAAWPFGEVARARELIDEARARAVESNHAPTLAVAYNVQATLGILRDEAEAARRAADALVALSREHGLQLWLALGTAQRAWARVKLADRDAGSIEFRQALADYARGGNKQFLPFFRGLLAEIEAELGSAETALAGIDGALALSGETGEHWFDAGLHRIRGEILLKQNPADPAPAEAAFLAALAVAEQQKARSFALRAALSLAQLFQSMGRPVDAHDVLAPALEGFAPTPELPQIAEAQAQLAALEETDAVLAARRNRGLRAKYARAMYITQGFTATTTQAAFDRAEATSPVGLGEPEQAAVLFGRWAQALMSGKLPGALEAAEAGLRDAEAADRAMLVATAHRLISPTKCYMGSFAAARDHAERALALYGEHWTEAHRVATGADFLCSTYAFLSAPLEALGEVELAAGHVLRALQRGQELRQPFSVAMVLSQDLERLWIANRPAEALRVADELSAIVSAAGIGAWDLQARLFRSWASGRLSDPVAGAQALRDAWSQAQRSGARIYDAIALHMLADLAAATGAVEAGLSCAAQGLDTAAAQDFARLYSPLHRVRGDLLAPRDAAGAEAAYRESIHIARGQGARTFVLLAALPLAKLLQANNRPVDAYDALAPALEGFAPMPELPEIAEAQALLAALAAKGLPRMQQK